jgi:ubiquinone/menaquinone biosynthesis C-methylase UbiE
MAIEHRRGGVPNAQASQQITSMNEAEFDKFADEYHDSLAAGIAISGESPEYFSEYKIADIARECAAEPRSQDTRVEILDFGAGIGNSVPYVGRHFPSAQLTCLDLSQRSLEVAERRFAGQAKFVRFDGVRVPFADNCFDIAYAMCVFHHIDHADHGALLRELSRVIKPGGSLFVFEHNPFNPLTVRVVNACPFDENAHLIRAAQMRHCMLDNGFTSTKIRYRVFFPHFLRSLRPVEGALSRLPLGGQYYVRAIK